MKTSPHTGSVQSTKQLADYLGLSRWTVSRVLNGHAEVNESTAKRVVEAARDLGFSPNLLAQGLRSGRTKLVGVIIPDLVTYNLTAKVDQIQERLARKGYQTLFSVVQKDAANEQAALQQFSSMRAAGLITFAVDWSPDNPWVKRLESDGMPVVHVDPKQASYGAVVRTDRENAMKQLLDHLFNQGHRHIAIAGVDARGLYGRQRIKGLQSGCLNLGLVWGKDLVMVPGAQGKSSDIEYGHSLAAAVKAMRPKPTAVISLNDQIAFGLLQGLKASGTRIPEQLALTGYDNDEFSAYTDPALTTVDPRVDDLMDRAVDLLFEGDKTKRRETRLTPRLVLRESTAAPGKRKK